MTEPRKERDATRAEGVEQAPEDARSDAEPSSPGGKAMTAPEGHIEGRAMDTITDEDGHYLEPPD